MMSKERDRDYTDSKGNTSGTRSGMVVVQCMRMSSPAIRQERSPAKSMKVFSRASWVLEGSASNMPNSQLPRRWGGICGTY